MPSGYSSSAPTTSTQHGWTPLMSFSIWLKLIRLKFAIEPVHGMHGIVAGENTHVVVIKQ